MNGAVADTTVLSNFAWTDHPTLLTKAFDNVMIPEAVADELKQGEKQGRIPVVDWSDIRVIELDTVAQAHFDRFHQRLGLGEAACLAVAKTHGWMLLTDDRNARQTASSEEVAVSGTLGVLALLMGRDILSLDQADELLIEMIAHGYYSPVRSLNELDI